MIEDRDKNIVCVPVSRELLPELDEWSEPVQVRVRRDSRGELEFVFRKVTLDAADAAIPADVMGDAADVVEALYRDLRELEAELVVVRERAERLERAIRQIEALRTNEHAAGFDEAREIAAAVLVEQEKQQP